MSGTRSLPFVLRARESTRTSLWFVPTLFVLGALGLWLGMRALDGAEVVENMPLGFDAGPEAARSVLSAIAASMITFTAVVFSVTVIALQLASSQYSPSILRNFLRSRRTQAALGSFIATFVYALLVLRGVRNSTPAETASVPRLSVTVAFFVLAASLVMFVIYIHEIAQSMRASRIVSAIGDETRRAVTQAVVDECQRQSAEPEPGSATEVVLEAERPGFVLGFDAVRICEVASSSNTCLYAAAAPGDFVPMGAPLLTATHPVGAIDVGALSSAVPIGRDRTMDQDPTFGLRQLVDIALRALSSSINDPTTAARCLDEIHDLLRRIAPKPFRTGNHGDDQGALRFVERPLNWAEILDLTVTEIRNAGRDQIQIQRRLPAMLDDLRALALPERRSVIDEQSELLAPQVAAHASPLPTRRSRPTAPAGATRR